MYFRWFSIQLHAYTCNGLTRNHFFSLSLSRIDFSLRPTVPASIARKVSSRAKQKPPEITQFPNGSLTHTHTQRHSMARMRFCLMACFVSAGMMAAGESAAIVVRARARTLCRALENFLASPTEVRAASGLREATKWIRPDRIVNLGFFNSVEARQMHTGEQKKICAHGHIHLAISHGNS